MYARLQKDCKKLLNRFQHFLLPLNFTPQIQNMYYAGFKAFYSLYGFLHYTSRAYSDKDSSYFSRIVDWRSSLISAFIG